MATKLVFGRPIDPRKGCPVTGPVYVSINGGRIRHNAVAKTFDPPIRIARSRNDTKPEYANEIKIHGPAQLIYSPGKPIMRCGARLVLMVDTGGHVEITR